MSADHPNLDVELDVEVDAQASAAASSARADWHLHRPASFAEPVDINAADEQELERIEALNVEQARAILRYRDQHGPLTRWHELAEIPGVDAGTLERLREVGTLGDEERASRR